MGHAITALILRGPGDARAAREWDLELVPLAAGTTLVHLTHYYTAYQQARRGGPAPLEVPPDAPTTFPREGVVATIAAALGGGGPWALVMTDYFGGVGEQWAYAVVDGRPVPGVRDVNDALRALGVRAAPGLDEFDTVGLAAHRSTPDRLDRYADLCDGLGV